MKIVVAIDSFKGSVSSLEAGGAAREGFLRVLPDADVAVRPIADGGEGTVAALVEGLRGEKKTVMVKGPLGEPIAAQYGIVKGDTAVMEMSAAAGIALIPREKLDPMVTTTFGVGEMIRDAIAAGCRKFLIGIGGSATNDGGVGMLQALGFRFTDENGAPVPYGARGVGKIAAIDESGALPQLAECEFKIACDVTNPLCGEKGCSAIFAPQKGARPADIPVMDAAMRRYAACTRACLGRGDADYPGTGAAGGLGFAFLSYLGGTLCSGIDLVLREIELEKEIADADLVVTGEGRIDAQTVMGKAPIGVARLAKKHGKVVAALSGCASRDAAVCNAHGIDGVFPVVRGAATLDEAMDVENAKRNIADTAEQVLSLFLAARAARR